MGFKKAVRRQRPLRMALFGPSGSGKTYTGLKVLHDLTGGGKIAVIDTERSSASVYAENFDFDVCPLKHYAHTDYIALIKEATEGGYDGLLVDGISPAWEAEGGLLAKVDEVQQRKRVDSFRAWGDAEVKDAEKQLWAAILDFPGHVVVTMRAKTAYERWQDEKTGKNKVQKLGLAPIQRNGVEYEFDVIGRMEADNSMVIDKARDPEAKLQGRVINKPGEAFTKDLSAWLGKGDKPVADYRNQVMAICKRVAKEQERGEREVMDQANDLMKTQLGYMPEDKIDWEAHSNDELALLPDVVERGLTMDEEEQRQSREAQRETAEA